MKSIQITGFDGPGAVRFVDIAEPEPSRGHVTVEVHVAGVSFPEVLQTRGQYQERPQMPFTPGYEVAGTVLDPGESDFAPGQRVAGFCVTGGYAERVRLRPDLVFPLPDLVSFTAAAALPMNYFTAHFGLVRRGRIRPGETVAVHGAAGGVGSAALQVAKAFGAGQVIAVVSTDEKATLAAEAGADNVVRAESYKQDILDVTAGRGVDLFVDPVGGDRFTDSLRSLATFGRILVVGFVGGPIPTVKVNRLLLTNTDVVGVGWGSYAWDIPGYVAGQWAELCPHLESGVLKPLLGPTFDLSRAGAALAGLEERRIAGKVTLRVKP